MKDRRQLPALDKSPKLNKPDLPDISNKNYTDTILKYSGLATKFPQLNTNAKTVVAAINELNARPIPEPEHIPSMNPGSLVIANPPVAGTVLETFSEILIQTSGRKSTFGDRLIEVSTGEPAGVLYSILIDGEIYTIDTGVAYLNELLDVAIEEPAQGQILTYDGESWVNAEPVDIPAALDDLTDVDINNPDNGQVLKYEDGIWKNATDTGGVTQLSELEDVDVSTVVSGQFLKYDGTEWTNSKVDNDYVWEGTQAEYDAIVEKDPEVTYYITDAPAQRFNADAVVYNNANTKLTATTVQSAITEIVTTNIYWIDLVGILPSGSTSIRFQHSVITPSSTINVFVDSAFFGVSPTSITITPGIAVIGFEEQSNDMPVKVRIS